MPKRVLIPFRNAHKLKPYLEAVIEAGMEPVTTDVEAPQSLDHIEGLLLMGGTDVNPRLYHEEAGDNTDDPDDVRDRVELELIDQAIQRDMPIFAICRGLQILNVYHGGTLIQHLSSATRHDVGVEDKATVAHEISIEPESLLAHIAGTSIWQVNSRHHQAADRVGEALSVTARDVEDETIEALERGDRSFVLAVQWHPEDQIRLFKQQLVLFKRFAQAI